MRMDHVKRHIRNAGMIMPVQNRKARFVLRRTRHGGPGEVHKVKWKAAAISGIHHGGDHIAFVPKARQMGCIVVHNAPHTIHDRVKCIRKLADLQTVLLLCMESC